MNQLEILWASNIFFLCLFFIGYKWKVSNWRKQYPNTLESYLKQNPQAKTDNGIKCVTCGSKSLKNWGESGPKSKRRSITCNHCSSKLYRVEQ